MASGRRLAAVLAACSGLASQACGVCIEDKVAAAYDHEVVTLAASRGHVVVFAQVRGRGAAAEFVRAARAAAQRVPGVARDSVRVAEAPSALSFALDTRVRSPSQALAAVERFAGAEHVQLELLKVLR